MCHLMEPSRTPQSLSLVGRKAIGRSISCFLGPLRVAFLSFRQESGPD